MDKITIKLQHQLEVKEILLNLEKHIAIGNIIGIDRIVIGNTTILFATPLYYFTNGGINKIDFNR